MAALLSEANSDWHPVPRWAEFLIQLGYRWPVAIPGQRKIALVSMPCNSAAAGLVAARPRVRDLGRDGATNVGGHYDAILRYARQYIESCETCEVRCNPEMKCCGYSAEATGLLRLIGKKVYRVSAETDFDKRILVINAEKGNGKWSFVSPKSAINLQIEAEPPPRLVGAARALPANVYTQIVDGVQIVTAIFAENHFQDFVSPVERPARPRAVRSAPESDFVFRILSTHFPNCSPLGLSPTSPMSLVWPFSM